MPPGSKSEQCQGTPIAFNFSFSTEGFITNNPSIKIAWEKLEGGISYRLDVSRLPDCSAPILTFNQFEIEKQLTLIKDGDYHFCVFGLSGGKLEKPAANNGLKITVDTAPPVITDLENKTIEANDAVNPMFQVTDNTAVSFQWQSDSPFAKFGDDTNKTPDIRFTKNGTYEVKVKIVDAAGNGVEKIFTILWLGSPEVAADADADATDYQMHFEKTYYQTRSFKRILIDSEYIGGGEGIIVASAEYTGVLLPDYQAGITGIFANTNPSLIGVLPYGTNDIKLSLMDGNSNESVDNITVRDFTIFGVSTCGFADSSFEKGGLSGGFSPFGGRGIYKKGPSVLAVGFHSIVNQ